MKLIDIISNPLEYREDNLFPSGSIRFFSGPDIVYDIELCSEELFFWGVLKYSGFYYDILDNLESVKDSSEQVISLVEWVDEDSSKCSLEAFKNKNNTFIVYKQKGFYFIYEAGEKKI